MNAVAAGGLNGRTLINSNHRPRRRRSVSTFKSNYVDEVPAINGKTHRITAEHTAQRRIALKTNPLRRCPAAGDADVACPRAPRSFVRIGSWRYVDHGSV